MTNTAPGHWPSPISPDMVASAARPLVELRCHNGHLYWATRIPEEGGRQVVMEFNPSTQDTRCLTPADYSAQSRVHEYGGGSYALSQDQLFFVNGSDQCIYRQPLNGNSLPQALTTESDKKIRFGDLTVANNAEFLIAVREQHTDSAVINDLIRLNLTTQEISVIASGDDFYASPSLNLDNTQLTFLSWNHPHMPWEQTRLWRLDLQSKTTTDAFPDSKEAFYQPGFSGNELFYVSDRSGWWNLYQNNKCLLSIDEECGYPMWILGTNQVVFAENSAWIIAGKPGQQFIVNQGGQKLDLPFTDFQPTLAYDASNHCLYFVAGCFNQVDAIYQYDLAKNTYRCISKSAEVDLDAGYFSRPTCIELDLSVTGSPGQAGGRRGEEAEEREGEEAEEREGEEAEEREGEEKEKRRDKTNKKHTEMSIFGFYYPPHNPDAQSTDELPPLIVNSHGGPNGSSTTQCQFKIQFWTSRGFAYLDVNYRGSTGYGKAYRHALKDKWGIADVEDCCHLSQYCVQQGWINSNKLFIRGQSAGGLTALAACVFKDIFAGGTSCYGVADLTTLVDDTHKFEARYLDSLVGKYPEDRDIYLARSPAYHIEQLSVPLLFLQGLEDRVVPVEQTKAMTDKLDKLNKPYRYVEFSNEGHGFRRSENIITAMQAELDFYQTA